MQLGPSGSRMMPPPGLQICLRPRVTLTFDPLTPKLVVSCPCSIEHLANLHRNRFIHFQNIVFTISARNATNGWTDGRKRTSRQAENIMPPPANLASWRHIKFTQLRHVCCEVIYTMLLLVRRSCYAKSRSGLWFCFCVVTPCDTPGITPNMPWLLIISDSTM